jgi:hypothetical protein
MAVTVNPNEINPYPVNANLPVPSSTITITTENDDDGKPLKNVKIEVQTCTEAGRADTDGHTHDSSGPADPNGFVTSNRPRASLKWGTTVIGNPITVTTDDTGKARIKYYPPTTIFKGRNYYISGRDIIITTLSKAANPTLNFTPIASDIKDKSKTLTTRVPNLQQMPGSSPCPPGTGAIAFGGGVTYFFEKQTNHGCLFYGTQATNDALVRIANVFAEKQKECRDSTNHQCTIVDDNGQQKIVTIQGEPIRMKITAMALPWGGLSDINGNWRPSHSTHNNGKQCDIGWANLTKANGDRDMDRIWLFRYLITLDTNYACFPDDEGENIEKTLNNKKVPPHFHINFKE